MRNVLRSAAEIACKGRQDFDLGHNGGCMILIHSNICQEIENSFRENWLVGVDEKN